MARSKATTSLQDPNSNPLYIHSADHACITHVSKKLAGLGNFNTWRRSMLMALGARNKAVFVDGTYPELCDDHPDFASWSRCNNISDGPHNAEIKQQIFAEVQGSQSVSDYYTRLKQLWEEIKNHESPYTYCCNRPDCSSLKRIVQRHEQDKILKFLTGLSDTFTATRGQILMMEPQPNIAKVFHLVSQEERQRSMKRMSAFAFNVCSKQLSR
ncbi:hypothetical protein Bca52824_019496 [Brassica carinata]|uniref:Retrotransposon Copia-like N-terminal domain-containing protein n=1 Tax=Brassica carinata TaxID=52824 RepID=A0A8X8AXG1_BRACI|nr:hypothetical protein Bca52824_019496 [Brassica carinata]